MILLRLYAGATTLAAPLLKRMLRRRVARGKEIAERLPERWGEDATPRPPGRLLWMHAASVGETMSVLPVLSAIGELAPDVMVLMTTGTVTAAEVLARRLPELGLAQQVGHRFAPLDVPAWVSRFLDHWRPDAVAMVESEIWPNTIVACRRRRRRIVLLNARLSKRSLGRWRLLPRVARSLFRSFAVVQPQSAGDAERLALLGAQSGMAPGNLKFAAAPLPAPESALRALRETLAGRPAWLAASTHPGEEAAAYAVHAAIAPRHPGLLTVIVPRHPPRGAEVAALAGDIPVALRSRGEPPPASGVWVADTLGELGLFYSAIGTAFVGGSLVPHGGQNPLEAARLGCAVAIGPYTDNFTEPVAALGAAGALEVVADAAALTAWVDALLSDPARRARMGEAGRAAARGNAELPRVVARMIVGLLPSRPH
jgi:3-deoxy-D-manno-octulosonic-acid transferase